jgi:ABC-type oligopeptide transport system ATPase subunit
MEVHHHPNVEKKNFKEYFLEFLMIFLAVTMGFFAESIREHLAEKTNTKEYLETYRDELAQQQTLLTQYKKIYQNKVVVCDSVKNIFFNGEENTKLNVLERLNIFAITQVEIPFSTSSYDQMVNAGALRYINNIALRDSMAYYKGQIEILKNYNSRILSAILSQQAEIVKLMDYHDMITTDTSRSYNTVPHIPVIRPFAALSVEQRNSLVAFYEVFIVQGQSNLRRMRLLYITNQNLLKMVNEELEK